MVVHQGASTGEYEWLIQSSKMAGNIPNIYALMMRMGVFRSHMGYRFHMNGILWQFIVKFIVIFRTLEICSIVEAQLTLASHTANSQSSSV